MDKEETAKSLSENKFTILLPTKETFELRISSPAQALILASSLLRLLPLVLGSRETQWLVSSFVQVGRQMQRWRWYESLQDVRATIQAALLFGASDLLRQALNRYEQERVILELLLGWILSISLDGGLKTLMPALESSFDSIWNSVQRNDALKAVLATSATVNALKAISNAGNSRVSPSLRLRASQIVQLVTSSVTKPVNPDAPASKRRNVDNVTTIDVLFNHLLASLTVPRSASQDHTVQLSILVNNQWDSFTDVQRCMIAEYIGLLGCAAAGRLRSRFDERSASPMFKCSICDGGEQGPASKRPPAIDLQAPLLDIILKKCHPTINISVVRAFNRLITHDTSINILGIKESALAEQVLRLLHSENRDQRIAVTQTLPFFLNERDSEAPNEVLVENKRTVLSLLRTLQSSHPHEKPLLETTLMAYAEIGKVVTLQELCSVLSYLVDFLGHNNSFIAALAYREIPAIAASHGQSAWQMFSPFWSSISIKVVGQMISRPQILQRLSELLEIRDSVFLMRTQNFSVPMLVLGQHRDVLELMSQKMGVRVWEMLKENMPHVLAVLFTQEKRRTESGIEFLVSLMASTKSADANKPNIDRRSLIFSCRTPLTVELLKMLGSESDTKREAAFHALQTLALYVSEKPLQDIRGAKAQEFLKLYLQNNILELMNHFTDIITDKKGRKTFPEKIGCIAGTQEIIRIAGATSKTALPQVSLVFSALI